jgi:hypothetical protein
MKRTPKLELRPPIAFVSDVTNVTVSFLQEIGVYCVFVDVDNTLLSPLAKEPSREVVQWVRSLLNNGIRVCLVSNTVFPGPTVKRVRKLAHLLDPSDTHVRCVTAGFWCKKPGVWPFRKACELTSSEPERSMHIGDQLFTDLQGAQAAGIGHQVIVTGRLGSEPFWTWLKRRKEVALIRRWKAAGLYIEL